jgi:hypothetical protein
MKNFLKFITILILFFPIFIFSQQSGIGLEEIELTPFTTSSYEIQFLNIYLRNYSNMHFYATTTYSNKAATSTVQVPINDLSSTTTLNFNPIPLTTTIGPCNTASSTCEIKFYYSSSTTSTIDLSIFLDQLNVLNLKINTSEVTASGTIDSASITPTKDLNQKSTKLWINRSDVKNPDFINFTINIRLKDIKGNLNLEASLLNVATSMSLNYQNPTSTTTTLQLQIPSSKIPTTTKTEYVTINLKRQDSNSILASTSLPVYFENPPSRIYSTLNVTQISQFQKNKCLNLGSITTTKSEFGISFKKVKKEIDYVFLVCGDGLKPQNVNYFMENGQSSNESASNEFEFNGWRRIQFGAEQGSNEYGFSIKIATSSYPSLDGKEIKFYFAPSNLNQNISSCSPREPYYCASWKIDLPRLDIEVSRSYSENIFGNLITTDKELTLYIMFNNFYDGRDEIISYSPDNLSSSTEFLSNGSKKITFSYTFNPASQSSSTIEIKYKTKNFDKTGEFEDTIIYTISSTAPTQGSQSSVQPPLINVQPPQNQPSQPPQQPSSGGIIDIIINTINTAIENVKDFFGF